MYKKRGIVLVQDLEDKVSTPEVCDGSWKPRSAPHESEEQTGWEMLLIDDHYEPVVVGNVVDDNEQVVAGNVVIFAIL